MSNWNQIQVIDIMDAENRDRQRAHNRMVVVYRELIDFEKHLRINQNPKAFEKLKAVLDHIEKNKDTEDPNCIPELDKLHFELCIEMHIFPPIGTILKPKEGADTLAVVEITGFREQPSHYVTLHPRVSKGPIDLKKPITVTSYENHSNPRFGHILTTLQKLEEKTPLTRVGILQGFFDW